MPPFCRRERRRTNHEGSLVTPLTRSSNADPPSKSEQGSGTAKIDFDPFEKEGFRFPRLPDPLSNPRIGPRLAIRLFPH